MDAPPHLLTPERLILLVTHRCQLRCEYCRVRKFGMDMPEKILSKAVRFLMTSSRPSVQLQFFGGEPLLRFDLIQKAAALAESLRGKANKKVSYLLTTNGIALDKKTLAFLKRRGFYVEFSCDGAYETQTSQRKVKSGTDLHARVMRNLKALRVSGIPYHVISVTTPENVSGLFDNFQHLVGLGHRRIQLNYCLGRLWPEPAAAKLLGQMERVLAFIKRRPELEFINATVMRREPAVLNSELTVDCDGGIYRETGICLEEDFSRAKKDFFVADIKTAKAINDHGTSPFDNFHQLAEIYGKRDPSWRAIILNNIQIGWIVDRWIRRSTGSAPC